MPIHPSRMAKELMVLEKDEESDKVPTFAITCKLGVVIAVGILQEQRMPKKLISTNIVKVGIIAWRKNLKSFKYNLYYDIICF